MPRYELNEIANWVFTQGTSSIRTTDAGSTIQKLLDYTTREDDNPVYVGYNDKAKATSDSGWLVNKITYDASNRPTSIQSAIGKWDDRATLTYN